VLDDFFHTPTGSQRSDGLTEDEFIDLFIEVFDAREVRVPPPAGCRHEPHRPHWEVLADGRLFCRECRRFTPAQEERLS
jgi:hypothetical protein